ncbi:MAG: IS1182 family transposase [Actinomycetota bacterium]|nr:IS1182 family transposase [Actinomycetota bacterium]
MALGVAQVAQRFENPAELLGDRLRGIYRLLADHGERMFPHDYFSDLYKRSKRGRPTIPARVLATVMILQAHEGLSDQEACDRLERDLAWQAAAGVDTGAEAFHPTVLVGLRNRLRASARPRRLFADTKAAASEAGVMGSRVRVLDSTPVYDAVATQDTVTQLRSAIRKLLGALDRDYPAVAAKVRAVLTRDDDYAGPGKPPCDWDDPAAREALVDALVKDALAALAALEGESLEGAAADAAELLATVAGQDVEAGEDKVFRIARRVAVDRVISVVDTEARHGHKSHDRRFDGFKVHLSVDPDSELIDEVIVTAANAHDSAAVDDLLASHADDEVKPTVMGDCAYGGADTLAKLAGAGYDDVKARVPPARGRQGRFGKDDFDVDLQANTVTCPAGHVGEIRFGADGSGRADFAGHCGACPLREACTTSAAGRSVTIHPKEDVLQAHKAAQADPDWQEAYTGTRPKVERKIGHFVRRAWGGRKARVRGRKRIATDADTRAAAVNWSRLATMGVTRAGGRWATAPP